MHIDGYLDIIKYVFGVICLGTAFVGLRFSLVGNELAARGTPVEKFPGSDEPFTLQLDKDIHEIMERQQFLLQSGTYFRVGATILFASVAAGLTINFPWLVWIGVVIIAATLYYAATYWNEGQRAVIASREWEAKLISGVKNKWAT